MSCWATVFVVWVGSDSHRSAMRIPLNAHSYAVFSERGQLGIDNSPALEQYVADQRRILQQGIEEQRRLMEFLARKVEGGLRSTFAENPNWIARLNPHPQR
jgi:hypothetical protein